MNPLAWLIFAGAALLEVLGDAVVRRGLLGRKSLFVILGCLMLGGYGLVVNLVRWDFSRLLGIYVGFFALTAVLFGKIVLREEIPASTWVGLGFILLGGAVIQWGRR